VDGTTLKALERYDSFLKSTKKGINESKISRTRSFSTGKQDDDIRSSRAKLNINLSPYEKLSSFSVVPNVSPIKMHTTKAKMPLNYSSNTPLSRRSSLLNTQNKTDVVRSKANTAAVTSTLVSKNSKNYQSRSSFSSDTSNYIRASIRRSSTSENRNLNTLRNKISSLSSSLSDKHTAASSAKRSLSMIDVNSTKRRSSIIYPSNKATISNVARAPVMNRRSTFSNIYIEEQSSNALKKRPDSTMQQRLNPSLEDVSLSSQSQAVVNNVEELDVQSIVKMENNMISQLQENNNMISDEFMQNQPKLKISRDKNTMVNVSKIDKPQMRWTSITPNRASVLMNNRRLSYINMKNNRTITRQLSSSTNGQAYLNTTPSTTSQTSNINTSQPLSPLPQNESTLSNINITTTRSDNQQINRDTSYRLSSMVHGTSNPLRNKMIQTRQDSNSMKLTSSSSSSSSSIKK